jgi:3-deoxy-D-manno-octulosonic-acid transferase
MGMYFFYNLLLRCLTVLLLPVLFPVILFRPKWRIRWNERVGFLSRKTREAFQSIPRPRIWFHAASMGEVAAIVPIANAFKERNPNMAIVISTNTVSGLEHAGRSLPSAAQILLLPLDYPGVMRRIVHIVQPDLLVIAETELWPNLIRETKRFGSQIALVNGRLSEKSQKGYQWLGGLVRRMMDQFDLVVVQTEKDAERLKQLGANPQRTKVLGNVKFDAVAPAGVEQLRQELRLNDRRRIWVAGSVRPGEEELVLDAWETVRSRVKDAVLIFAPRHMDRAKAVEQMFTQRRLAFTRRSRVTHELLDFPVILLDTMGELSRIYGLAGAAFVGGSLAEFGGHNPLEPASQGVPVLFGPHMEHFARTADILLKSGGAKTVANAEELAEEVVRLLSHPEEARRRGGLARQSVLAFQGVAGRTVDLLQKLMLIKRWATEVKQWREESLQTTVMMSTQNEVFKDEWPGN